MRRIAANASAAIPCAHVEGAAVLAAADDTVPAQPPTREWDMNRTEQQPSESQIEDLTAPQSQQLPAPEQEDAEAVKGGIIIVGGSPATLLQPNYASLVYYNAYY